MDPYRFYLPDLPLDGSPEGEWALPAQEAHHARAVLRLEPGEPVAVFNGRGAWASGTLARVSKAGVAVQLHRGVVTEPAPTPALTLATAVPKGDRAAWLIEQASQLHVMAVQWLDCDRSVVKPHQGGQKMEKWQRLALESAKQCGRAHLLEIHEATTLAAVHSNAQGQRLLWLDPGPGGLPVEAALEGWRGGLCALIGPEGGWSDGERALLEQAVDSGGARRVRLTRTVLRIETACAALAAVVMCR